MDPVGLKALADAANKAGPELAVLLNTVSQLITQARDAGCVLVDRAMEQESNIIRGTLEGIQAEINSLKAEVDSVSKKALVLRIGSWKVGQISLEEEGKQ